MELTETADHPKNPDTTMCKVQIRSQNGQDILFTFLDTKIIEMLDGMVYIHGVNFDIFACPTYAGQKEREVVEIEEINTIVNSRLYQET